jgi:hypothetical protein
MSDKDKENIQMKIFEMVEYIQENKLDIKEFELLEIFGEELNQHYGYKAIINDICFNTSRDGIWGLPDDIYKDNMPYIKDIYESLKINLRDHKINNIING